MASSQMQPSIPDLLDNLRRAASFEEVALAVLQAMIGLAGAALTTSPWSRNGRIVRAVAHLRPGDAYRGLAVLEAGVEDLSRDREATAHLTSTTAWRWVAETHRAVSIDVHVGRIEFPQGHGSAPMRCGRPAAEFDGADTR